jgi:hypothetical protein
MFPMVLQKPEERPLHSVYSWLARGFEVNLDDTLLTVHVVVQWDNLWTLLSIFNTNQWKSWITEAKGYGRPFDILVQFIQKPHIPVVVEEQG